MKKLILCMLLLAVCLSGWSQALTGRYATVADGTTLTNTSTVGTAMFLYSPTFQPAKAVHSLQYVGTKLSGFAKGSVSLWGTIDGTSWLLVANDSLSLVNGLTYTWDVTNKLRRQYRVRVVAIDSTQSIQNKVYFLTQ